MKKQSDDVTKCCVHVDDDSPDIWNVRRILLPPSLPVSPHGDDKL